MGLEIDRASRALEKYIAKKGIDPKKMAKEQLEALSADFSKEYEKRLKRKLTEASAENVYDYLELASNARTKKKRKELLEKALALEPKNLDARVQLLSEDLEGPLLLLDKIQPLLAEEEERLKEDGVFEDMAGDFCKIPETRPFMRLLYLQFQMLSDCNMTGLAIQSGRRLLDLDIEDDEFHVRYHLMPLLVVMENEFLALQLAERYPDDLKTVLFLLPLSLLYFKMGQREKAATYLDRMRKVYRIAELRYFSQEILTEDLDSLRRDFAFHAHLGIGSGHLLLSYFCGRQLYESSSEFLYWMRDEFKQVRRKKGKSARKR